jgi:hypothetical protein
MSLLFSLACTSCYVGAPAKSSAAASTLGPQAFVEEQLLSAAPWVKNARVPGGGVVYVAHFNEESSSQLSVPRETVQTYCEAKGGKLVFVQLPAVQAGDLSAPARPAVAELLREADRAHQFGTFQCESDGESKWSARIEPRSLSVNGLPKLSVFIACDEQPTKLGGVPTLKLLSDSRVASIVTTAAQARLASRKPLPAGATAPHILVDSVQLPGGELASEAILAIRLFRCEGTALQLGHDLLVCSASDHEACATELADRIAEKALDDSTRGTSACSALVSHPPASTKPTFVPVMLTALAASSVAQTIHQGLRRELSADSFLHVDEPSSSAQLEVMIYDAGEPARDDRASGYAILSMLRCAGTPLYFGHHLGVSNVQDMAFRLKGVRDGVAQDALRAGAYLQGKAARCAP